MPLRPVTLDDSLIGQPLPWALYNAAGVLVASAGTLVSGNDQLDRLSARPLFRISDNDPNKDEHNLVGRLRYAMHMYPRALEAAGTAELETGIRNVAKILLSLAEIDYDASFGLTRLFPMGDPIARHCLLTAQIVVCLGIQKNLPDSELESVVCAALTMNIAAMHMHGKLAKGAIKFEGNVKAEIQRHPERGAAFLEVGGVTDPVWLACVRQHHENLDGSGYPLGLHDKEICLGARLIRVADYYTAKIDGCRCRPNKTAKFAFKQLLGIERGRIDSHAAVLLLRRLGLYPSGTLVRLANRETALVPRKESGNDLAGHVIAFLGQNAHVLRDPVTRNTALAAYAVVDITKAEPAWPQIAWERYWGY